jgi:hypothetical protein
MSVFCTSKLFTPYHNCKIFWAYDLPLQHSSATLLCTREFYKFVSWWLQEQELIGQQQRQCQRLVRKRKGVSQQQEHVNGVNANQRSNEVKYCSRTWWGMQRGMHVCQRIDGVEYGDQSDGLEMTFFFSVSLIWIRERRLGWINLQSNHNLFPQPSLELVGSRAVIIYVLEEKWSTRKSFPFYISHGHLLNECLILWSWNICLLILP